jgi:hypothetical protein
MIIKLPADTPPVLRRMVRDVIEMFSPDPARCQAVLDRIAQRQARDERATELLAQAEKLLDLASWARSPKRINALIDEAQKCEGVARFLIMEEPDGASTA